ncbi:MAG: hypothetical protein FJZ01_03215 [Candidatus Sericytochromatia bacterium]|nr:hypothetical protein [Candidatus Tanganyikabacteria bacterium]
MKGKARGVEIKDVIVERHDADAFCGIITFSHRHRQQMLTWSFQVDGGQKVVIMLYPSSRQTTDMPVVEEHYREFADAILDQVFKASG